MSKLRIKDKHGIERVVTKKSYDLIGEKHKWQIIGDVPTPKSEMEELKDKLRAEKAAKSEPSEPVVQISEVQEKAEAKTPAKRGPKPKSTEA